VAEFVKVPPSKARPPDLLPRLSSVDTASVPPLIAVPPEYELFPESVSVPVPTFTREPPVPPELPPSTIVPPTVVLRLLLPTMSALEPR
jgi:hypothetical protein